MNSKPKEDRLLTPKEAFALEEGDPLLHDGEIVFVEKVENGFGLLEDGEAMVWAAAEGGRVEGFQYGLKQPNSIFLSPRSGRALDLSV